MTQSFDEWYSDTRDITAEAGWKAGAASRQAEIDELHLKYSRDSQALHNVIEMEVNKRDELQKRIDGALKELELIYFYKTQNSNNAIKILKGKQDD